MPRALREGLQALCFAAIEWQQLEDPFRANREGGAKAPRSLSDMSPGGECDHGDVTLEGVTEPNASDVMSVAHSPSGVAASRSRPTFRVSVWPTKPPLVSGCDTRMRVIDVPTLTGPSGRGRSLVCLVAVPDKKPTSGLGPTGAPRLACPRSSFARKAPEHG